MCLRIIFNMHINDGQISQIIKGHRMTFTYLEYGYNFEIFYTNIYSELSFKLYIFSFIYCLYIYTNTFGCSPYYKYFHTTKHSIKGRGSENIKGYCKIHVLCL